MRIQMAPKDFAALLAQGDTAEAAVRENRCLRPPIGCGKPIQLDRQSMAYFPNVRYRDEWKINGLCPSCQDHIVLAAEESEGVIVRGTD